ncbi:hydrogenase maturation protease [Desulfohalobiaceae bacterium Ax17]|uniref:hydrogenase maturation protease n=1 Tax=Desulfovulcanus ferrireducens TaxID=2831190 RepID=UPI00207BBA7D|nr:hydrogenase maturation protease [Desulfovulcanus ferrireducens]MBT8764438.1 hydrogenase maturation protease [Desulfovulcanus ferrireducens]
MKNKNLVLGIGNPLLTDDRAGIEVVEEIVREGLPVDTEILYTVGFEVIDKVLGYESVIVVDASKLGHSPGTIVQASLDDIFNTHALVNSHAITLGTTLKTGYILFPDEMPSNLRIILIEVDDIDHFSDQCTPKVKSSVHKVVKIIKDHFAAC